MTMTNGTTVRETPGGLCLVRGQREVHLLGTSATQAARARRLATSISFDRLFKPGRTAGAAGRNVRYVQVAA